eukprot:CAMPEP_0185036880 /NCGR_PEP_ID=MMETSP1103-20130426/30515_1 /TAXON_ID=36769 /ORGANISM="Paraphysomonas bandaiensis, Strain Caron Lab Isolate" /LENGTH=409 /DNA_ID=CAMNT_0027574615 /DNA_START=56 /DNA_END=1285 /DNA_ORIENTATION=-
MSFDSLPSPSSFSVTRACDDGEKIRLSQLMTSPEQKRRMRERRKESLDRHCALQQKAKIEAAKKSHVDRTKSVSGKLKSPLKNQSSKKDGQEGSPTIRHAKRKELAAKLEYLEKLQAQERSEATMLALSKSVLKQHKELLKQEQKNAIHLLAQVESAIAADIAYRLETNNSSHEIKPSLQSKSKGSKSSGSESMRIVQKGTSVPTLPLSPVEDDKNSRSGKSSSLKTFPSTSGTPIGNVIDKTPVPVISIRRPLASDLWRDIVNWSPFEHNEYHSDVEDIGSPVDDSGTRDIDNLQLELNDVRVDVHDLEEAVGETVEYNMFNASDILDIVKQSTTDHLRQQQSSPEECNVDLAGPHSDDFDVVNKKEGQTHNSVARNPPSSRKIWGISNAKDSDSSSSCDVHDDEWND